MGMFCLCLFDLIMLIFLCYLVSCMLMEGKFCLLILLFERFTFRNKRAVRRFALAYF